MTAIPTSTLTTALDMMENFNWAQLGDAIQAAQSNPVAAVEEVANVAVQAANVAGVPFAGTVATMLPLVEKLFGLVSELVPAFGGATGAAATAASTVQAASDAKAATQTQLATAAAASK